MEVFDQMRRLKFGSSFVRHAADQISNDVVDEAGSIVVCLNEDLERATSAKQSANWPRDLETREANEEAAKCDQAETLRSQSESSRGYVRGRRNKNDRQLTTV